ncbi:MAG TPA: sensor domain-containing diguanylate cyclase [Burkholderiaceae bacterium]|jgi:diguanylate cyclase (GGDEF)-like protein|nr:sensor domain-containing diguanylate cyclase [Burkholderiaceae bacterium]
MKHKDKSLQSTFLSASEAERGFAVNLMEHLVVPTFVLDTECRVMIWNHACERLTGIAAADMIGTSDHWRGFYNVQRPCLADLIALGRTNEVDSFYPEHGAVTEPRYGLYAENWCVMPHQGARLYLAIDAGPIYDRDGKLIAVVETLRDMTLQKLAQAALQELANHDGLTGIANRRSFDETLKLEWRRTMRDLQPLSLLMVDVDHFKKYNDTYGHIAGDECLKRVASTMANQMQRASDVVARYGGEEFAVILPNSTIDGANVVAERVRSAIEELKLTFAGSDFGNVTVSIGAASITPTPLIDSWQLISTADAALYDAKNAGRNRIASMQVEPLTLATHN